MDNVGKPSGKKVHFKEPEIADDASEASSYSRRSVTNPLKRKSDSDAGDDANTKKIKTEFSEDEALDQALSKRAIDQYNQGLHESRVNDYFTENDEKDARIHRDFYRKIVKRMKSLNLDMSLLHNKSSEEVEDFLLMHDVFSVREIAEMAAYEIDLEGSPYW